MIHGVDLNMVAAVIPVPAPVRLVLEMGVGVGLTASTAVLHCR